MWPFKRKLTQKNTGPVSLLEIQDAVRNAVSGFEYERKHALASMKQAFTHIGNMRHHQERIEAALKGGAGR